MNDEQARMILETYAQENFGRLARLRNVVILRKSSGRWWRGELVCDVKGSEVVFGHVEVGEDGRMGEAAKPSDLIESLLTYATKAEQEPPGSVRTDDWFADFDLGGDDEGEDIRPAMGLDHDDSLAGLEAHLVIQEEIKRRKQSGTDEDLAVVRELLPRLLDDWERRRFVLVEMGEVELRLGESDTALEYLAVAAREFADRAEMKALELVSSIALRVLGEQKFEQSVFKQLLDMTRRRTRPLVSLEQAPAFVGLPERTMAQLADIAKEITIQQGSVLLQEGAEAVRAFVIRSGVLSIRLGTSEGRERVVRCAFPGDFIGETSVLGPTGATCTATVKAESVTSLWSFPGKELRKLAERDSLVASRIHSAQALHRLDSFFSMNETTQTLNAAMRDEIFACVKGFRRAEANELLNVPGEVPSSVYLISEGHVIFSPNEGENQVSYGPDQFIGLRDAIHQLPAEGGFIAQEPCRLVEFDAAKLRAYAAQAPPDVVAVFERLD